MRSFVPVFALIAVLALAMTAPAQAQYATPQSPPLQGVPMKALPTPQSPPAVFGNPYQAPAPSYTVQAPYQAVLVEQQEAPVTVVRFHAVRTTQVHYLDASMDDDYGNCPQVVQTGGFGRGGGNFGRGFGAGGNCNNNFGRGNQGFGRGFGNGFNPGFGSGGNCNNNFGAGFNNGFNQGFSAAGGGGGINVTARRVKFKNAFNGGNGRR